MFDFMRGYEPYHYLFLFFVFCNIGWVQESVIESLYHRRWINRGFLKGPYIPIYGFGGMLLLFCGMPFKWNGFLVYISGMVCCTILEYFTGWLMERFFHRQFWDYSMMRFTYKNRISLLSSLFWGILSLFMTYMLSGVMFAIIEAVPNTVILLYDLIMAVAVTIDSALSISQYVNLREQLKKLSKEKAKQIIYDKFISIGGAVTVRRRKLQRYIARLISEEDQEPGIAEAEEIAVIERSGTDEE